MSRKGNYLDNTVAESFFHSLKIEFTNYKMFKTRTQTNKMIFEYIEVFYNRQRMHSSNNYLSPVEYEEKMLLKEIENVVQICQVNLPSKKKIEFVNSFL